jgi:O-antigen ligase
MDLRKQKFSESIQQLYVNPVTHKVNLFFFYALMASLPFTISILHNLSSYAIWGWGISCLPFVFVSLLNLDLKKWIKNLLPIIGFYLFSFLTLLYSEDLGRGFKLLETQLSLILFPVLFSLLPREILLSYRRKVRFFPPIVGVFLVIAIGLTFKQNYEWNKLEEIHSIFFFYHNLSSKIGISAIYLSLYVSISIILLLVQFGNLKRSDWLKLKGLYLVALIMFLLSSLLLLSSKMVIISFGVGAVLIVQSFLTKYRKFLTLFLIVLIPVIGYIFNLNYPWLGYRVKEMTYEENFDFEKDPENVNHSWNSLNMRQGLWICAFENIQQKPVFGWGIGSDFFIRNEVYKKKNFRFATNGKLNEHNQYLGVLVRGGTIGLLLLLLIFGMGTRSALKSRDVVFYTFLVICGLAFITENFLEAQKGTIFFGFFFSLFYFRSEDEKNNF